MMICIGSDQVKEAGERGGEVRRRISFSPLGKRMEERPIG